MRWVTWKALEIFISGIRQVYCVSLVRPNMMWYDIKVQDEEWIFKRLYILKIVKWYYYHTNICIYYAYLINIYENISVISDIIYQCSHFIQDDIKAQTHSRVDTHLVAQPELLIPGSLSRNPSVEQCSFILV